MKLRHTLASCLALSASLHAAPVTLTAGDGFGASSFNTAGGWDSLAAPTSGNDYFTGEFLMRTPATDPGAAFAGDSLTINPSIFNLNMALMFKGPGYTLTIPNLKVDGGYIRHGEGDTQFFVLDGGLEIGANGGKFNLQGPLDISSLISGSGTITNDASASDPRTLTFSNGANTFTGDIVNNGRFVSTGRLNFVIGASGINNSISGTGPKTNLNGTFYIDLSGASSSEGDSWNLVPATTKTIFLTEVTGPGGAWSVDGTTWTDPTTTYQFSETSGIITVIPPDGNTDNDHDLYTKLEEINAGTDPNDVFSSPDSDADGLADGFEVFYFGDYLTEDLATILPRQAGTDDADTDGYSNQQEANATPAITDPTDAQFTPVDTDGDDLIDSWEMANFMDLDEIATGNPDSDSGNNLAEQLAGSNPNNPISIPTDTNANGTPDASEVLQPYTADSNTLHLWHLDGLEGTPVNPASDAGSDTVALTSLANGATLWQPSLAAFSTALDPSANRGTAAGGVLSALPLADGVADSTAITLAGPDGAFTFEAVVRIDFDPTTTVAPGNNMQIISGENEDNANRIFQFRIIPIGSADYTGTGTSPQLEFIGLSINGVGADTYPLRVSIPEGADPDAIAQGNWYHVAVAYNGLEATTDNIKLYWTLMDGSRSSAHEILSTTMGEDLPVGTPDFAIGNEGRSNGGASDNFLGLIDEVRISAIARSATGFYFSGAGGSDYDTWALANGVTGGASGDDDMDSLTNDEERLFGLDANSGASVDPIAVPFDKTSGNGKLSYTRRKTSLTGASYSVWTSTTLSGWTKDNGATQSITGTIGDVETVEIELSAGLTASPKLFVRIQAD